MKAPVRALVTWLLVPAVMLPEVPHRYAPDPWWPGSCWCSKPREDHVHRSAGSGARAAR